MGRRTRTDLVSRLKTAIGVICVGVALCCAGNTRAQGTDALLKKLVEKGILTPEEAAQLRTESDQEAARLAQQYQKSKFPKWIDEVNWSGDLRLRVEYFDFEDQLPPGEVPSDDLLRYRFRLRFGMELKFVEWATVGVRLISDGPNPVASFQTFTDSFSKKPINIDLAYATVQPPGWDWVKITGGKMPNPIWQSSLLSEMEYDPDVTPEGIAEQFNWKIGKGPYSLFANFGQYAVQEFNLNSNDAYMYDLEGGLQAKFKRVKLTAAGGYYFTHNLDMVSPGASPNLGNATTVSGTSTNYLADFDCVYVRGELAWTVSDRPLWGTPRLVTLSGEYIHNFSSAYAGVQPDPDQVNGYSAQISLGDTKLKGQWLLLLQYKYLQANATWDAVTDSEWGGTDREGYAVRASYNLQDWWQLIFSTYLTQKISDTPNTGHNMRGESGENLLRLQADTLFRF